MRYLAVACDEDDTLASTGWVAPNTVAVVTRLKSSGWRVILATRRELEDFLSVFSQAHLFDRVVAENGALLHDPTTRRTTILGEAIMLRCGEYSRWLRESIKDNGLAERVGELKASTGLLPRERRRLIREAIEQMCTLPATGVPRQSSGRRPELSRTGGLFDQRRGA